MGRHKNPRPPKKVSHCVCCNNDFSLPRNSEEEIGHRCDACASTNEPIRYLICCLADCDKKFELDKPISVQPGPEVKEHFEKAVLEALGCELCHWHDLIENNGYDKCPKCKPSRVEYPFNNREELEYLVAPGSKQCKHCDERDEVARKAMKELKESIEKLKKKKGKVDIPDVLVNVVHAKTASASPCHTSRVDHHAFKEKPQETPKCFMCEEGQDDVKLYHCSVRKNVEECGGDYVYDYYDFEFHCSKCDTYFQTEASEMIENNHDYY